MKKTRIAKKPFRSPERTERDKAFAKWFGGKIKEARKASKLSPEKFAEEVLGVSLSSYFQYTSGGSSLSEGRIYEISQKIGLKWKPIIGDDEFIYPN